ncbi:hypothetical protein [Comamonas testosteroni]|uniref:hypothetical protein n=1 Tax=Comamonas testosteroni TaxID=285 RepID=UPI0026EDC752|nr:hypothetical protein [Comamonas testosteroni]
MKNKLLFTTILLLTASSSYAQALTAVKNTTLNIANQSFSSSAALDAALNGVSNAMQRTGQAATSAAAAAVRSNVVRSAVAGGATAGLVGLVAGVAVGALLDWSAGKLSSNADGSLNLTNKQATVSSAGAFAPGQTIWTLANSGAYTGVVEASSITSLLPLYISANQSTQADYSIAQLNDCYATTSGQIQYYCNSYTAKSGKVQTFRQYVGYQKSATKTCSVGFVYNGSGCVVDPAATIGEQTQIIQMSQLLSKLSTADKATAVSSTDLSNLTNAILQSLNQSGYQNAPMTTPADFTNANVSVEQALSPITQAQVDTAAVPATSTVAQPSTTATTSTSTTTTTDPSTGATTTTVNVNAKVDLGADPGIGMPTLESTPTAQSILDPIFNLMPRTFTLVGPQGSCPNPTIVLLGHSYNFDMMCNILNQQAGVIAGIMLFAFTIAAIKIVLSA